MRRTGGLEGVFLSFIFVRPPVAPARLLGHKLVGCNPEANSAQPPHNRKMHHKKFK